MSNKTLNPQDTLDHWMEIIRKGAPTADGIGEALWQVDSRELYRPMLSEMKPFFDAYANLSPKKGAKIIEEWKRSEQGRAVIGQQPIPDVEEQVKPPDAASTISAASNRARTTTMARAEPPPVATNAPAGSAAAPAGVATRSEFSLASRHGQPHEHSVLPDMNYEDNPITSALPLMESGDLNDL